MRFIDSETMPVRNGNTTYPWPRVAEDGRPAILEYGQDWDDDASAERVINSARAWGYRRGFRVKTRVLDSNKVCVQFIRPGGGED